ncbi:MAG: hypothetical protein IT165_28645 [Bryobacterales bacterium]|nr:hypothetical protein [Bryobacterales bacterium]
MPRQVRWWRRCRRLMACGGPHWWGTAVAGESAVRLSLPHALSLRDRRLFDCDTGLDKMASGRYAACT